MSMAAKGSSRVPPGFRFHPTEEELLNYYLRKKVACEKIDLDVIRDVDLNKFEPWDIQEKCRIGTTPQNDWYLFSHKDKKYPTGTRTNRATAAGFWKATGRDKVIHAVAGRFARIGQRKTLVFYKGRAPHGQKSDWIMHEYRLDDNDSNFNPNSFMEPSGTMTMTMNSNIGGGGGQEDGWVVCRVFKKKNYQLKPAMATGSPNDEYSPAASTVIDEIGTYINSGGIDVDDCLDQMLDYMARPKPPVTNCKQEMMMSSKSSCSSFINYFGINNIDVATRSTSFLLPDVERLMKLPDLESAGSYDDDDIHAVVGVGATDVISLHGDIAGGSDDWEEALQQDGIVASGHLNVAADDDGDLWSFARQSAANN